MDASKPLLYPQEIGCVTEPIWTLYRSQKCLRTPPYQVQNSSLQACTSIMCWVYSRTGKSAHCVCVCVRACLQFRVRFSKKKRIIPFCRGAGAWSPVHPDPNISVWNVCRNFMKFVLGVRSMVQKFPAWHTKAAPNGKFCEGCIVPSIKTPWP